MTMVGDGPQGQPTEGGDSLSQIGEMFGESDETLDESEQDEGSDEAEEGADEEEEGADEPAAPEKQKFTIKHDGKEIELELTPDEHVAMLQQSLDYTKKTMAVAEERKAVTEERAKVTEVRQRNEQALDETISRLEAYTKFMESQVGGPPSAELLSYDTSTYLIQKEQYEARKGQLHESYAAIKQLHEEKARQRQAWIAEKAESTEKVLRDTLPGWNDDALKDLAGYADTLGLNPQTAETAMLEPGFWKLAHKAREYDRLMSEKSKLKPKADMPKVNKPGASNPVSKPVAVKARKLEAYARNPSHSTIGDLI